MAERQAEIIGGVIHLAGGQMLIEIPVIEPSYHEVTGGTRRTYVAELGVLPAISQDLTDRDIREPEWNPNLTREDIQGF